MRIVLFLDGWSIYFFPVKSELWCGFINLNRFITGFIDLNRFTFTYKAKTATARSVLRGKTLDWYLKYTSSRRTKQDWSWNWKKYDLQQMDGRGGSGRGRASQWNSSERPISHPARPSPTGLWRNKKMKKWALKILEGPHSAMSGQTQQDGLWRNKKR